MNHRPVFLAALLAASVALAGCGASAPSTQPPASPTGPVRFDLAGTAWRVTSIGGQEVAARTAPDIQFDWLGRPDGRGFTGCNQFGFSTTISGDRMTIGDVTPPRAACDGAQGRLEELFLATFQATRAWSVDGDRLTLAGVPGQIVLARRLPPMGDPGRQLADALTDGTWRVVRAPGVAGIDRLPAILFADSLLIAAGECGFSSDFMFGSGGALDIVEVDWDVAGGGCDGGPNDGRPALKALLEAVTTGRLDADGTIVLSGPRGEVVLGR